MTKQKYKQIFFILITENSNFEILTMNVVTFKR